MHMADALLSPEVGAVMWAASAGATVYAAKKINDKFYNSGNGFQWTYWWRHIIGGSAWRISGIDYFISGISDSMPVFCRRRSAGSWGKYI